MYISFLKLNKIISRGSPGTELEFCFLCEIVIRSQFHTLYEPMINCQQLISEYLPEPL